MFYEQFKKVKAMKKLIIAFVLFGGIITASAAENMSPVETLVFETKTGEKFEMPVSNQKEIEELVPLAVRLVKCPLTGMATCPFTGTVHDHKYFSALILALTKPEHEEPIPYKLR